MCYYHQAQKYRRGAKCANTTKLYTTLRLSYEANVNYNLQSYILLIFKYYLYISREKHILNKDVLIANLMKVKKECSVN